MKNQYFGDVNDYMMYGLLRCCAAAGWRVGVCWMLTPDDARSDGARVQYLSDTKSCRHHDPVLFDLLESAIKSGERNVSVVENGVILPDTTFFPEIVPDHSLLAVERARLRDGGDASGKHIRQDCGRLEVSLVVGQGGRSTPHRSSREGDRWTDTGCDSLA